MKRRSIVFATIALAVTLPALAAEVRPPFDPKDVVRRVQARGDMTQTSDVWDRVPGRANRPSRHKPTAASIEPSALDAGEFLLDTSITYPPAPGNQNEPAVAVDGENFLVVWTDVRSRSYDIYGCRVSRDGTVFGEGPIVRQEGSQLYPALARGPDNQMFLVYQGWAGTVGGKTYNADRIWGKMNPVPAVAEMTNAEVRMTNGGATVVRGVLYLRPSPFPLPEGEGRGAGHDRNPPASLITHRSSLPTAAG